MTDTGHGMNAAVLPGTARGSASRPSTAPPGRAAGWGWADSEPGRGTTVQVYWPEILAAPEAPPEPERPPPLAGGSETVLVVEDDELVRALAVRALRSFG